MTDAVRQTVPIGSQNSPKAYPRRYAQLGRTGSYMLRGATISLVLLEAILSPLALRAQLEVWTYVHGLRVNILQ